jgi:hypothetical protein
MNFDAIFTHFLALKQALFARRGSCCKAAGAPDKDQYFLCFLPLDL